MYMGKRKTGDTTILSKKSANIDIDVGAGERGGSTASPSLFITHNKVIPRKSPSTSVSSSLQAEEGQALGFQGQL